VALLVGIGHYTYLAPPLEYVSHDVQKIRDYLLTEGGFDEVYVMNEAATPQMVESYMMEKFPGIANKAGILGKEDRLLFYFSGHGSDSGGGHPFLQFQQARLGEWSHDVLRVDSYQVWSDAIPAKHILFIFDACFAGEALPKAPDDETRGSIAELSANGSRTVVTAGTAEQRAWMTSLSSDHSYSIFTEGLLRALRGGMADRRNRGFITIEQAVAEAQVEVADITRKLGPGHEMKPQPVAIRPKYKGSFVFLNLHAQKPTLPEGDATFLGVAVAKGTDSELDKQLELAFWKSVESLNDPGLFLQVCARFPNGVFCPVALKRIEQLRTKNLAPSNFETMSLDELKRYAKLGAPPAAITQLGKAYESGSQGASIDLQKSVQYYTQAANLGDGVAAFRLGEIYIRGRKGIPVDLAAAAHWYEVGTRLNNADCMNSLGTMYVYGEGGKARDMERAIELFQKSATLGNARGNYYVGVAYQFGRGGLPKDESTAVEYFQKADELGDAGGTANLGNMYQLGWGGLPKDEHKAVELYWKSTALGDASGAAYLGIAFVTGIGGLATDEPKAVDLFKLSADLGDPGGMAYLGVAYLNAQGGLAKDERKAVELFQKSADLGDARGMFYLGLAYEKGFGGLSKDMRKAAELYKAAAAFGAENAAERLDRLNRLTPAPAQDKGADQLLEAAQTYMQRASGFHVEAEITFQSRKAFLKADIVGRDYDISLLGQNGIEVRGVQQKYWKSYDSGKTWQLTDSSTAKGLFDLLVAPIFRGNVRAMVRGDGDSDAWQKLRGDPHYVVTRQYSKGGKTITLLEMLTSNGSPPESERIRYWVAQSKAKTWIERSAAPTVFLRSSAFVDSKYTRVGKISQIDRIDAPLTK
jgi:TPR repeat protein